MSTETAPQFKAGDWVVFDLRVGHVRESKGDWDEFSDGTITTSGRLQDRFRPLTLRNKVIAETFDYYYRQLNEIDGNAGFNYPDISQHFAHLALDAMDANEDDAGQSYDAAAQFVSDARDYKPEIQGIALFRRKLRAQR